MLYDIFEANKNLLRPLTIYAKAMSDILIQDNSWASSLPFAKEWAGGWELFYRLGRDYKKPAWNIHEVDIGGHAICPVVEQTAIDTPFCKLVRFKRFADNLEDIRDLKKDPIVLIVAPLSGHFATLLRDTVKTMLQDHKVFVTDWKDARFIPVSEGEFGLDDYVKLIEHFLGHLLQITDNVHVFAVCQPVVPVLAACARMSARGEKTPASMILMGGPIDARKSPTTPNNLATKNDYRWFEDNLIHTVPSVFEGGGRRVYPGFLQHMGFVAMNPERHMMAHWDFYEHLVQGDNEDAQSHRDFYNEYNAVLDMPAKYYLDTIKVVFQDFLLPQGKWVIEGVIVQPEKITQTALLAIEGERDDIAGQGQTKASLDLCSSIPEKNKEYLLAQGAGHYGLFSGRRWRTEIYPALKDFIMKHQPVSS